MYGLRVRVARLAGWTYGEAMAQPMSWVYELAADAKLEHDSVRDSAGDSSRGSSSPGGKPQRISRYTMKPKK